MILKPRKQLWLVIAIGLATLSLVRADQDQEDPGAIDINDLDLQPDDSAGAETSAQPNAKDKPYTSPTIEGSLIFDSFDDEERFKTTWIQSKDSKYNGRWKLESGPENAQRDLQLVLPEKARHYGISAKLVEPFKFSEDKPLIVQYEAQFRDGLDCGGAYVKLLRNSAISDLTKLTDKTPFSIMFGPDKCGSEVKLHFIVQYLNPKTQEYSEKHWKQAKYVADLMSAFTDKKYHLFKMVLQPSGNFELFLDGKSAGKGDLLQDMDPPINPPEKIVDPDDKKPEDWDERPQIDDPDAKKPDDWDEDAPKTIEDPNATKPDDWLENESKLIPDASATKPADWEEMDGDWEAPKVENPKCAQVSGCGEWKPPQVPNPAYKGKWRAPKIDNPKYKGKWAPRMIQNPDYFYDEKPFASLDSIGAIAYELWSMAENVAFDNLIITSDDDSAKLLQKLTWQNKKAEADAASPSLVTRAQHYLKTYPWLWAVVVLGIALPLFLFVSYCCDTKRGRDQASEAARRKKEDESRPDNEASTSRSGDAKEAGDQVSEEEEDDDDDEEDEEEEDEENADGNSDVKNAASATESQVSRRSRRKREE